MGNCFPYISLQRGYMTFSCASVTWYLIPTQAIAICVPTVSHKIAHMTFSKFTKFLRKKMQHDNKLMGQCHTKMGSYIFSVFHKHETPRINLPVTADLNIHTKELDLTKNILLCGRLLILLFFHAFAHLHTIWHTWCIFTQCYYFHLQNNSLNNFNTQYPQPKNHTHQIKFMIFLNTLW